MEELPNHPRGDAAGGDKEPLPPAQKKQKVGGDAAGDEKKSLPPVEKEQGKEIERMSDGELEAALLKEEVEILEEMVMRSIMCEEDDALEDVSEWLSDLYRKGTNLDEGNKWFKYLKMIVESEGFDMDIDDLPPVERITKLPFVPSLQVTPKITERAKLALDQFNQKNGSNYEFVKVEKANARLWGPGHNSYITFQAIPENSDAADGLRTFQALVFSGADPKFYVKFCRPKAVAN